MAKSRQTRKVITSLKDKEGKINKETTKILDTTRKFYEDLYSSTSPSLNKITDYIENTKIDHKLNNEEAKSMEGILTIEECKNSLFKMRLNRSPGLDGLSVEFYRTFWDELKEFIVTTLNHSYEKGEMTNTQKVGLISLIHKKVTLYS